MIETVIDSPRHAAGLIESALGAPIHSSGGMRTVGPFVVIAHVLPLEVEPWALPPDFDVRPHPHIGLVAISYMLDGYITHRDSLGSHHEIGPGGVNYMFAGRGVVHSERFERLRLHGGKLQMLQILLALPDGHEESEPRFISTHAAPETIEGGAAIRYLGSAPERANAGVLFPAAVLLCDVTLEAGGRYPVPEGFAERAVYVLEGIVEVDGTPVGPQKTGTLAPGPAIITGVQPARVLVFGGEPVGPRYMWWNFIHSSLERLEAAKSEWRAGGVLLPPGDTEAFAPAPPDDGRPLSRLNTP
jgi:redox-sensitive bicupin YhaK (pirin superfamily)